METTIVAAWPGSGKTTLCRNNPKTYAEIECWEYRKGDFPCNYVQDVLKAVGETKYLFISIDPVVSKELNKMGIEIQLVYPENQLKEEYHRRYKERGSNLEFIDAYDRYSDVWLDDVKELDYGNHTVLQKGEYLEDVLKNTI